MKRPVGILITNTGTPDSPTVRDTRRYLKSFLSDPRVVRIPRMIWLPLLHLFILRSRAPYAAKLYQHIWTPEGSPLKVTMHDLTIKLEKYLNAKWNRAAAVECGMHYGTPSIPEAIEKLRGRNVEELFIFPLFPQFSTATTETAHDQVRRALLSSPQISQQLLSHYADHPAYIAALTKHIKSHHDNNRHLLFSFHGLPQQFIDHGDPYAALCQKTACGVANALALPAEKWSLAYQSRFGYAKWLKPYTIELLKKYPQQGVLDLSVICPGFAVDCLETLEEIQLQGKKIFLQNGGRSFQYIPALNAHETQVEMLGDILIEFRKKNLYPPIRPLAI